MTKNNDVAELKAEVAELKADLVSTNVTVAQLIAQMETKADKAASASLVRKVIDSAGTKTENMSFGEALEAVKNGKKIARKGWNGKGQYVFLIEGMELTEFIVKNKLDDFATGVLAIKTSNDITQVGWLASQTDMLASDWYIV